MSRPGRPPRAPFRRHPKPAGPGQPQTRAQLRFARVVADPDTDWVERDWRDEAPQLRVARWQPKAHLNGLPTRAAEHAPTLIEHRDVAEACTEIGGSMLYYPCPLAEARQIIRDGQGIQTICARKRDRVHPFLRGRAGCVYLKTGDAVDRRLVAICVDLLALEPHNLICDPATMPHTPSPWPREVLDEIGGAGGPFDRFIAGRYGTGGDSTLVELVDALPYDRGDLALAGLRAGAICHLGAIPAEAVQWNARSNFHPPAAAPNTD